MRVVYLITALYLVLPFAGLYTVSVPILNVYNLSINSVYELRQSYPIYLACFALAFVLPFRFGIGMPVSARHAVFSAAQMHRLNRYITGFLVFAMVFIFLLVGRHILSGAAHRGEIRTSFGGLGFLYKTFVQYWVPAALAVSGMIYRAALTRGLNWRYPLWHLSLTILTLAMMGYKSGIIVGILPFLFLTAPLLRLRNQILTALCLVSLLIYYSMIIMNADNMAIAAQYLFIRGTEGTAWGLIASWDLFEHSHPEAWLSLVPVFGPRITAALLDIDPGSIEYLMLGSGQYVTYLVHPDPSIVLAGETNLTITLAGEAIYLMGRSTFWILALPVGFLSGLLYSTLRFAILRNDMLLAPLLAVLVINILLPLLNSGGIVSLFSAFNIFYMFATMIFIKLLYMTIGHGKMKTLGGCTKPGRAPVSKGTLRHSPFELSTHDVKDAGRPEGG